MNLQIMTLGELKDLEIGSTAHIKYWDKSDEVRIDEVMTLTHKDPFEYGFDNGTPIPIWKITTGDDTLLDRINNSGWKFTIYKII